MNWFSVLAAFAVLCTAYFGADHPTRTITLQLAIALVTSIGFGIEWWKESKDSRRTVQSRPRADGGEGLKAPAPAQGLGREMAAEAGFPELAGDMPRLLWRQ